jgi:H+/Cl- antiporter ClcA
MSLSDPEWAPATLSFYERVYCKDVLTGTNSCLRASPHGTAALIGRCVRPSLVELRPRSLLPVALSCAVAGFLRPLWADSGPLFPLQTPEVTPLAMLSCCLAGLAAGAVSASMTRLLYGSSGLPLSTIRWGDAWRAF